jgi:cardiolipin synthase A/B
MKLIVQPDAGVTPILSAIRHARRSIDLLIFRLDRYQITDALAAAVRRGVPVRALIAHTNSGGEKSLRNLELHLLEAGVTVSRTGEDLVRYHGKMMIVDASLLHVYGFNFTWLDTRGSRSFGLTTRDPNLVAEAQKLFEADCTRQPYSPGYDGFVVSPENARERLSTFIAGARKQLLIYDPKLTDRAMIRLLVERVKAGVDVRIMGKLGRGKSTLSAERYPGERLHVRAIVRDGRGAFVGSQSLRRLELEKRREVGLLVADARVVSDLQKTFERDWSLTEAGRIDHDGTEASLDAPAIQRKAG